jgi:hypothetical protein
MLGPPTLELTSIKELLAWYDLNLCNTTLIDPRGYRVRFLYENFVHLIQLKTKYGKEPKNARVALQEIERGRIAFKAGRFDCKRAMELPSAAEIAQRPDMICTNWQVLGRGDEAYVKNFGTEECPQFRVLICEVLGTVRQAVTVFPRERIGEVERRCQVWP